MCPVCVCVMCPVCVCDVVCVCVCVCHVASVCVCVMCPACVQRCPVYACVCVMLLGHEQIAQYTGNMPNFVALTTPLRASAREPCTYCISECRLEILYKIAELVVRIFWTQATVQLVND